MISVTLPVSGSISPSFVVDGNIELLLRIVVAHATVEVMSPGSLIELFVGISDKTIFSALGQFFFNQHTFKNELISQSS